MTLIQAYQINLPSLGPFVSGLASGTGISNNYYPATGNPSGFLPSGNLIGGTGTTISQSGQYLIINSISSSPATYFGYTGFTISGTNSYTGNLVLNQGILTTRINIVTGLNNNWTGQFIIGNINAFAGAIARFNFQLPSGTGYNIQVSGYNGSVVNQVGLTTSGQTYMEFSFNGSGWYLDYWI